MEHTAWHRYRKRLHIQQLLELLIPGVGLFDECLDRLDAIQFGWERGNLGTQMLKCVAEDANKLSYNSYLA